MNRIKYTMLIIAALCMFAASLALNPITAHAQTNNARTTGWTICRDIPLEPSDWNVVITPRMTLPACYNGSRIWQNGPVSYAVNTLVYQLGGITWAGTYNNGGSWIGAGENYTATLLNYGTFTCNTRWMVDAWGNVFSYDRGCD
jgi:hypothetical protein